MAHQLPGDADLVSAYMNYAEFRTGRGRAASAASHRSPSWPSVVVGLLALLAAPTALAQESPREDPAATTDVSSRLDASDTRSGYREQQRLGSGASVESQLEDDDELKNALLHFTWLQDLLVPYHNFKTRLDEKLGLAFGTDYSAIYQVATSSPGQNDGASSVAFLRLLDPPGPRHRQRRLAGLQGRERPPPRERNQRG